MVLPRENYPGPNISLSQLLGPFLTYDAGQWARARPSRRGLRTMCGFRPCLAGQGPIEEKIRHTLNSYITGRMLQSDDERALLALPARICGLAFTNLVPYVFVVSQPQLTTRSSARDTLCELLARYTA